MYDTQYGLLIDDILSTEDPDDLLWLPQARQQIDTVLDSLKGPLTCVAIKKPQSPSCNTISETLKCFIAKLYMGDRWPQPHSTASDCLQAYQLNSAPEGEPPVILDMGVSASLTSARTTS